MPTEQFFLNKEQATLLDKVLKILAEQSKQIAEIKKAVNDIHSKLNCRVDPSAVSLLYEKTSVPLSSTASVVAPVKRRTRTRKSNQPTKTDNLPGELNTPAKKAVDVSKEIILGTTQIVKDFGGVSYMGTVSAYDSPYYDVVYDDGDSEEMQLEQILSLMVHPDELPPGTVQEK